MHVYRYKLLIHADKDFQLEIACNYIVYAKLINRDSCIDILGRLLCYCNTYSIGKQAERHSYVVDVVHKQICDQIWENVHSSHIRFSTFKYS